MLWAEDVNASRTVRAVVQVVILVGMLRWLHLYYRNTLKLSLANGAMTAMVVLAVIMVSYYTIQPWTARCSASPPA